MFGNISNAMQLAQGAAQAVRGFNEANSAHFEDIPYEPTYRVKPLPKLIYVRWADAFVRGSGNLQYVQWSVRLPEPIQYYNELSLVSFGINWTWLTSVPTNYMIMINELQASQVDTTVNNTIRVSPTWIVPSNAASQAATAHNAVSFVNDQYRDRPYATSIRNQDINVLTVSLGGDDLNLLSSPGAGTGTFYCNMVLWAQ